MARSTIQQGQVLWCAVSFRHGRRIDPPKQGEVRVLKVGRKYADLDSGDRLHIDSMTLDGGQYGSPGKCFVSKDAYDATEGAALEWRNLRIAMDRSATPDGVTIQDIRAARALLKV